MASQWIVAHAAALDADVTAVLVVPRVELWELAALQMNSEESVNAQRRLLEGVWTLPLRHAGCRVMTRVVRGDPATELCDAAARSDADLLVIGAKSHSAIRSLLGGTAHRVANQSQVPVVLVPSPPPQPAAPDMRPVAMLRPFL